MPARRRCIIAAVALHPGSPWPCWPMLAKVYSAAVIGVERLRGGGRGQHRPAANRSMVVVGLPDARRQRKSRDRVITAVANSGYRWPQRAHHHQPRPRRREKGGTELRPADCRGHGGRRGGSRPARHRGLRASIGELALTGAVRPRARQCWPSPCEVQKLGPAAALRAHWPTCARPHFVEGIDVYGVRIRLREVFEFLRGGPEAAPPLTPTRVDARSVLRPRTSGTKVDFSARSRASIDARRALESRRRWRAQRS